MLALGMAAALSSPALAAGGDAPGASVTGEPYYGTDYVQFEIRGADDMFYDVLYNGAKIYQHVSYTDPDDDGVNPGSHRAGRRARTRPGTALSCMRAGRRSRKTQ